MEKKRILITGAAGFIGSHVAQHMVTTYPEYTIVGVDKLSYCSNLKNMEECKTHPNFTFMRADITDIDAMKYIFSSLKIDTVLHFAAYTHVDHSFANSIIFTKNNVLGTHILLEVSKEHRIDRFVHVSTDEVYGGMHSMATEQSILAPTNPYAATKAAAEHLVMSYHLSFGLNTIITRGNNVYGPKQYPEKLIPKFIRHLLDGEKCPIQGSGEQKRSFLYTDDVVQAFDLVLHKGKVGEIYNIGSEVEYSVNDVFMMLIKTMYPRNVDDHLPRYFYTKDRDFNDLRYFISVEKLEKLGWRPRISFEEGLVKTVEWCLENEDYFNS
uniref:GDP-mannose 4,6 dehydratase n=1 Tax=Pithovirus LCPAC304 TaxID=2506594 RepID=A0A481ZCA2_9VIRU|nr:MAG: GDP-mannose 4,6 dehydratase [Pithovirus LCPAC304]